AASIALFPRTMLLGMVPLDKPPEVLQERAREILAQAGHDGKRQDSLFAFQANPPYLEELLRREGACGSRCDPPRSPPPGGTLFWYGESPWDLMAFNKATVAEWLEDPPDDAPGMARVALDPAGHLVSLQVVPGPRAPDPGASEPDWEPLLRATGIDGSTLAPVPPEWAPPVFADRRAAWTGSWPGKPDAAVRIEGASAGGKPVSLRIVSSRM